MCYSLSNINSPCSTGMLEHPVVICDWHTAFLGINWLSANKRGRRRICVINTACAVPGDILIPVVSFSRPGQSVFRNDQLALHIATLASSSFVIVIDDLLAADDNLCAELTEH